MATPDAFAPLAITRRSGFDESVHFGAVVGLSAAGEIEFSVGDPSAPIYPRSSNKPMQAVAMVRRLAVTARPLGAGVRQSRRHAYARRRGVGSWRLPGSTSSGWRTPPTSRSTASAEAVLRAGGGPTPLQMNCSGKHSGMVVTSAINGWPTDAGYLSPEHPLQQHITATIDDLAGEDHSHIGVDGCGSPAHVISLVGLARAFRTIATGSGGDAGDQVYASMTTHPEMVGGDDRDVTQFMRFIPGLMAKDGADGVFAAAMPDGRAMALKIADGANRARPPVTVAALRALGLDVSAVEPLVTQWVFGHGRHVGEVRAIAP